MTEVIVEQPVLADQPKRTFYVIKYFGQKNTHVYKLQTTIAVVHFTSVPEKFKYLNKGHGVVFGGIVLTDVLVSR